MRHLRAVCAIADHGSISKAAAVLKTSQPSLAAQLRRIESMFGSPLFERGREGASPTPLGEWVLARSRSLLPAFEELRRDGMRFAGRRVLRVGCMSSHLAPHIIGTLRELLPDAEVTLRTEEAMDVLPSLLRSRRLELATLADYPGLPLAPPAGVGYAPVAWEPIFVGVAESHPLAAHQEIELADLAEEEWSLPVMIEVGHREHFGEACARAGFVPKIGCEATLSVAVDLIAASRCVGMFQATTRGYPGIVVRPLAGTPLSFRHLIGWTEAGPVDPHIAELVTAVRRAYWADAEKSAVYQDWLKRHGTLPQPQSLDPYTATV
ncbi:LysR family transcriptional regulator [Sphaerisporangium album]|uniref:LysR family transcriptional regulator n=1 Tax=Sphaerisporangium album TaxID=509200 RepID=A0A367FHW2_9ACTN|nr:LysR family transcriptional regulator [Sphaerisporangium album]